MKDEKYWMEKYKDFTPEEMRIEKINKEAEVILVKTKLSRLQDIISRWVDIENGEHFHTLELKILRGKKGLLKRECSLVFGNYI